MTSLGVACIIPALSDPTNDLLAALLLVPILTLILLTGLLVYRYLVPLLYLFLGFMVALGRKCMNFDYEKIEMEQTTDTEIDGTCGNSGEEEYGPITETDRNEEDEDEKEGELQEIGSMTAPERSTWQWGLYGWLYMLYFLYYSLANRSLEVFNCGAEPVTHVRYMQNLPWLECSMYVPLFTFSLSPLLSLSLLPLARCFQSPCPSLPFLRFSPLFPLLSRSQHFFRSNPTYVKLVIMAIVGFVVYVGGIPILFGWLLWRYRNWVEDPKIKCWLGNLYYCYKRKYFWFEMVILVRRLVLAILISTLPSDNILLPALIVMTLFVALLLQVWINPFTAPIDNHFETLSISILAITFNVQYLLTINHEISGTTEDLRINKNVMLGVLVVANLLLLAAMLLVLLLPLLKWIKRNTLVLVRKRWNQKGQ